MTERVGLYLMMIVTMFASCNTETMVGNLKGKITELEQQMTQSTPALQKEVINNRTNLFYEIAGERAYIQIDGRPAESYVSSPLRIKDIK